MCNDFIENIFLSDKIYCLYCIRVFTSCILLCSGMDIVTTAMVHLGCHMILDKYHTLYTTGSVEHIGWIPKLTFNYDYQSVIIVLSYLKAVQLFYLL